MAKKKRRKDGTTKKERVWNKTHGHCHMCGEKLRYESNWHMDHVVPRGRKGVDEEWNLLPICRVCNGLKKAATTFRMQRLLMYGRYCLDEATRRKSSSKGRVIYELVRRRVKAVKNRAAVKPRHVSLWKQTPKK